MSRRFFLHIIIHITIVTFVLASCASVPAQVSSRWTEEMFFKNAQEAMDQRQYTVALRYYEIFLVRFPENRQRGIAAEYERAFIHYKMKNYKEATAQYTEIIRKYNESPYAMLYPPRFKRLSTIGLKNVKKKEFIGNNLFWRIKEEKWAEQNEELPGNSDTPDADSAS